MIYSVKGKIGHQGSNFIVIETNSLSYQVFVTDFLLEKIKVGQSIKLFTYLDVRENAIELYGFGTQPELEYFKRLRSISGIGPKSTMNILSLVRLKDLEKAILDERIDILTKVSGISKRIAQRIILELKGKIKKTGEKTSNQEDDTLVIDVLINMGYTPSQARRAVKKIPSEILGAKKRIKQALKILSGR